jgi:hypothetical protein
MSTSRRGRHAERSPEDEAAPVVENAEGPDDVVSPVSDNEDWEPLSKVAPPCDATAAPTATTGNTLYYLRFKTSHEVILVQ